MNAFVSLLPIMPTNVLLVSYVKHRIERDGCDVKRTKYSERHIANIINIDTQTTRKLWHISVYTKRTEESKKKNYTSNETVEKIQKVENAFGARTHTHTKQKMKEEKHLKRDGTNRQKAFH